MISVIIPTCNRNDLLSKCLDHLHPDIQGIDTYEYEVIVCDDSIANMARGLVLEQYNWAQWIEGPKMGPAANRNGGAQNAKGEWLIFFDDDCIPDQHILNNYLLCIKENAQLDVIEGLIYSDDFIPPFFAAPINLKGGHLWSCNFAIKKSIFRLMNGFDENFKYPNLEDNDLYKRLSIANYKVLFNSKAKVYHPPRPVASPKKLAKYHESWIYYYSKFGENKTMNDLYFTIIRTRLKSIKHHRKSVKSIKIVLNLFQELYYTFIFSRNWQFNDKSRS